MWLFFLANLVVISSFQHVLPIHALRTFSSRKSIQKPLQMSFQDHLNTLTSLDPSVVRIQLSSTLSSSWLLAEEAVSAYSKVDKTGFIGFFAEYIENAVDFGSNLFKGMGLKEGYGFSIILFTLFSE